MPTRELERVQDVYARLAARGRESFDAGVDRLWNWWTPDRFARAWEAAIEVTRGERTPHRTPASAARMVLVAYLGSPDLRGRLVSYWRRGECRPSWPYAKRLDELFASLLGEDYTERFR